MFPLAARLLFAAAAPAVFLTAAHAQTPAPASHRGLGRHLEGTIHTDGRPAPANFQAEEHGRSRTPGKATLAPGKSVVERRREQLVRAGGREFSVEGTGEWRHERH
jgi:hypothetical protein